MPIDEFLRSTAALITAVAALVGAFAGLLKVVLDFVRERRREQEGEGAKPKPSPGRGRITAILVLTVIGGGILWARAALPPPPPPAPPPVVTISSPAMGEEIEVRLAPTGSGAFTVRGRSSGVFSDPNLRIYVLVHPSQPYAPGWWIQQEALVDTTGAWTAECWIGSPQFPPREGQEVDIVSVAALPDPLGRTQIPNPKEIKPAAQSSIVHFRIGSLKASP